MSQTNVIDRRRFMASSAHAVGGAFAIASVFQVALSLEADAQETPRGVAVAFSRAALIDEARKRAAEAYSEQKSKLPERFTNLSFDQYREIKQRAEKFQWRNEGRGFQVSLMHAGFIYQQQVVISVVEDGSSRTLLFNRDLFDYGANVKPPETDSDVSFSGFKVRRPLNNKDRWDEFTAFQGATYFRAIAKGEVYGVAARGLAINTADEGGEEFPFFERFWIERPEPNATSIIIHAFLDSSSCTGVYRFTLRPGDSTTVDVELTLFPRVDMTHVGLGTLTSMFLYNGTSRTRFDDLRPAVHGSDGLAIVTGAGERLWRPLANPRALQISVFVDEGPKGFGLAQRRRDFAEFEDLDTRYDLKPSCWVETVGDWGQGAVQLIEIPSDSEIHENIVAYWRPKAKLPAGQEFSAAYRLTWSANGPAPSDLGIVTATRSGQGSNQAYRRFQIDFDGKLPPPSVVKVEASASAGRLLNIALRPNSARGGYRVTFELDTRNTALSELRVFLTDGAKPASETWLYRWTA